MRVAKSLAQGNFSDSNSKSTSKSVTLERANQAAAGTVLKIRMKAIRTILSRLQADLPTKNYRLTQLQYYKKNIFADHEFTGCLKSTPSLSWCRNTANRIKHSRTIQKALSSTIQYCRVRRVLFKNGRVNRSHECVRFPRHPQKLSTFLATSNWAGNKESKRFHKNSDTTCNQDGKSTTSKTIG